MSDPIQQKFERALAERLLDEDLLTREELREAIENQVLNGGDLLTSIWELGLARLGPLTRIAATVLDTRAIPPRVVAQAQPDVLRLIPRAYAEKHGVIPVREAGRDLAVAMSRPWDLELLDDLGRRTRRRIKPFFLPEVPLRRLLGKLYRIPVPARFRLQPDLRRRENQSDDTALADTVGEDLISDEEFQAIYGQSPEIAPHPSPPASEIADEQSEHTPPEPALEPLVDRQQALAQIDAAASREELAQILLRVALSRGSRAVLMTRRQDLWLGWAGAGARLYADRIPTLMVPSEPGSIFGIVGQTGGHYLGPVASHPVHDRFLATLGDVQPAMAALFPIHFHGRIVFGIWLDGGGSAPVNPDIADLLIIAQRIPMAIDRLLRQHTP